MRWGRNWGSERRSVVNARRSKNTLEILRLYVLRLWRVGNLRSIPMRASSVGELQNDNALSGGEDRARKDNKLML